MRKKIFIALFFTLALLMTSCGASDSTNDAISEYQDDNNFVNFNTLHHAANSELGFYFTDIVYDQQLMFYDKKSKKSVPLCGKPNCSHNNKDCNAFLDGIEKVFYYDDSVYVIASSKEEVTTFVLYKLSKDGSTREVVTKLFSYDDEDGGISLEFVIHRGYAYMVKNWSSSGNKERTTKLESFSLDDPEKKITIFENKCVNSYIYIEYISGNHIYVLSNVNKGEASSGKPTQYSQIDVNTKESKKLDIPNQGVFYGEHNQLIYYFSNDMKTLCSMKMDGSDPKKIYEIEYDMPIIYCCGNNGILYENSFESKKPTLTLVGWDGKEVFKYKNNDNLCPICCDENTIFFRNDKKNIALTLEKMKNE